MNVNNIIMQTLKDIGVPVSFLVCYEEPSPPIYVTFFEVGAASYYADDDVVLEESNVQIDIWASFGVSITGIKQLIFLKMKNAGWVLTNTGPDLYEQDTKKLHKPLEFRYESEVI